MSAALLEFARRIGFPEERLPLLRQALTHRSACEGAALEHNERLEFLGDSVLALAVAETLFHERPEAREGALTTEKARLQSRRSLAAAARRLGMGELLTLSAAEAGVGGRERESILENAFEAVLGALYLTAGYDCTRRLVRAELLAHPAPATSRNYKAELQEHFQQQQDTPTYRLLQRSGPDHAPRFRCAAELHGETLGEGEGPSKQEAEKSAAADALRRRGLLSD